MKVMRAGKIASFSPEMEVACQECGQGRREVRFTHFRRVVGLVFLDQIYTHAGYFCSSCRRRLFFKYQALTLLLGWWGLLAMLIRNPYAIFSNFMALLRPPLLPGASNAISLRQLQETAANGLREGPKFDARPREVSVGPAGTALGEDGAGEAAGEDEETRKLRKFGLD